MTMELIINVGYVLAVIFPVGGLGIFVYKLLFKRPTIDIVFDRTQSFIGRLRSDNIHVEGKWCLGLYDIKFIGKNSINTTIKEIKLYWRTGRHWHEGNLYNVRTSCCKESDGVRCVVVTDGLNKIVLMNWVNFLNHIEKKMETGQVRSCSALFILNEFAVEKTYKLEEARIELVDYNGKVHKSEIVEKILKHYDKNLFVMDKEVEGI